MIYKMKKTYRSHQKSRISSFAAKEVVVIIKSIKMTMTIKMCKMKLSTKIEQMSQIKSDIDSSQVKKIDRYNIVTIKERM